MTIDELIENFELFDEWEDRYRYVIDLGRGLPPLEDRYHTDAFKVEGCMSQVWLVPLPSEERRMRFAADSDSAIVKGLAAVLLPPTPTARRSRSWTPIWKPSSPGSAWTSISAPIGATVSSRWWKPSRRPPRPA